MLMDESIRWAKEQKATKLYVSAYWGNKRARDFYKKNPLHTYCLLVIRPKLAKVEKKLKEKK